MEDRFETIVKLEEKLKEVRTIELEAHRLANEIMRMIEKVNFNGSECTPENKNSHFE